MDIQSIGDSIDTPHEKNEIRDKLIMRNNRSLFLRGGLNIRTMALIASFLLAGCTGIPDGVTPVRGFQLKLYLGTWYEIARLDHGFERGLVDVTATYRTRPDGGIDVLNRGFDPAKQAWRNAKGRAYFLDTPDIGSLKVSFFGPFYGGYHVMALDPDYRWAMVAGPTHEYFWILARAPILPDDALNNLLQTAKQAGFNLDGLVRVSHGNATEAGK
jgi:apolipoprotein D and lipocalin family protein